MTDYGHIDLWDIREELMNDYDMTDHADMASPEEKMETRNFEGTIDQLYNKVKTKGFQIDTRAVDFLLIKGQWARSFKSFEEACNFALYRFDKEQ